MRDTHAFLPECACIRFCIFFITNPKIILITIFGFYIVCMCCAVLCWVAQSCDAMDCSPPGSSAHGDSPGKNPGVGCMPSSRGSSQLRDRTQVSHTAGGFFTEPPGKPKNTAVGSLSLLQGYCVCVYAKMSLYTLYNNPLISDSSIPGRQEKKLPTIENQSRRLCHQSHMPWRVKHPRVNWH